MKPEEKGLAVSLAGAAAAFLVALVASKLVLSILAGDAAIRTFNGEPLWLSLIGVGKHCGFHLGATLFIVIPIVYAASARGLAAQIAAGVFSSWAIAILHLQGGHPLTEDSSIRSIGLLGVGLTVASGFTSYRRYLAAEFAGLAVGLATASLYQQDEFLMPAAVIGLLVLGPTLAVALTFVHLAQRTREGWSSQAPAAKTAGNDLAAE